MARQLLILTALLVVIPAPSNAYNYWLYRPYAAPYGSYGFPYHPHADLEVSRLRRDLRKQQRHAGANQRRHEQEVGLLRQQAMTNHQISAQQACYYRSTGGFELCADLFAEAKPDRTQCEALVVQRNPGCNTPPITDAR